MREKIFTQEKQNKELMVYIAVFFFYLVLSRIVPITYIMSGSLNSIFSNILAIVGIFLILQDFFTTRKMFQAKYSIMFVVFLGIVLISSLLNIQYGIFDNLKTVIWFCIQFFLFYSLAVRLDSKKIRKYVCQLLNTLNIIWSVCIVLSIIQYIFQIKYKAFMHEGLLKRQGFYENRLFGVFSDPNAAAIMAVCLIFFCLYMCEINSKTWKRIVYWTCIVIYYVYIILSGSRSAFVCLLGAVLAKVIITVRNNCLEKNYSLKKIAVKFFMAVTLSCILFTGGYTLAKKALSYAPLLVSYDKMEEDIPLFLTPGMYDGNDDNDKLHHDSQNMKDSEYDTESVFDREDVREGNMLNHRGEIWKGYISSLQNQKWIFGLSPRNAVQYIAEKYPDNYIAKTQYIPHSDYLAVLAYTGVLGVVTFLGIVIMVALFMTKKMRSHCKFDGFYMMSVAVIAALVLYGITYMDILFCNTLSGIIFWIMMSILLNYNSTEKEMLNVKE